MPRPCGMDRRLVSSAASVRHASDARRTAPMRRRADVRTARMRPRVTLAPGRDRGESLSAQYGTIRRPPSPEARRAVRAGVTPARPPRRPAARRPRPAACVRRASRRPRRRCRGRSRPRPAVSGTPPPPRRPGSAAPPGPPSDGGMPLAWTTCRWWNDQAAGTPSTAQVQTSWATGPYRPSPASAKPSHSRARITGSQPNARRSSAAGGRGGVRIDVLGHGDGLRLGSPLPGGPVR
jgi:hypothetical protein